MPMQSKTATIVIVISIPIIIIIGLSIVAIKFYPIYQERTKTTVISKKSPIVSIKQDEAYKEMMITFMSTCDMAHAVFPIDTITQTKEKCLADIKDIGIYYWNRNIEILDEGSNKIDLSPDMKTTVKLCKEYCSLNKKYCELAYKALNESSSNYDEEINFYAEAVNEKLAEIRKRRY